MFALVGIGYAAYAVYWCAVFNGANKSDNAQNDVARCAGVGGDEEGWREGCEDCARRLAESTSDVSAWMMPPAIIAFWCEFSAVIIRPEVLAEGGKWYHL